MKGVTDDSRLWPEQLEGWSFINHDYEDCKWMYKVCVLLQNKVEFIFLRSCHNFKLFYNHFFFVKLQKSHCDLNGTALSLKINLRRNGILTKFHLLTWTKYSLLSLNKVLEFFSYRFLYTS